MELLKREIEGKKGIILIMALWIMTILSVVAVSFAFMMRTEMKMAANYRNGVKAHYLALAGVEHAIAAILNDATNDISEDDYTDHYGEAWHEEFRTDWDDVAVTWKAKVIDFGEGTYAVHLSDENSKLNLNYANASGVWYLMTTDEIDDAYFHRKTCNILDYRDGTWAPPFTDEWGTGSISYKTHSGSEGTWCKDNFFDTVYEIQKVTGINFGDDGVYDNPLDEPPAGSTRGSQLDMTVYSQDRNTQVDGNPRQDINESGLTAAALHDFIGLDETPDCTGILDDAPYTKYGYPLVGASVPGMGVGAVAYVGENQYSISETEMMNIADKIKIGTDNIIKGTININTATIYGLRGLYDIDDTKTLDIISARNTTPFAHRGLIMDITGIKRFAMQQCGDIITVRSDRFRIYSTGTFGSAVRRIEAVVDRDGNEDGTKDDIKVLYWSEKVFED